MPLSRSMARSASLAASSASAFQSCDQPCPTLMLCQRAAQANGHGELRVLFHRPFEEDAGLREGRSIEAADQLERAQRVIVGGEHLRPLAHGALQLGAADVRRDAGDDLRDDAVLHLEELFGADLHLLGPERRAGRGLAELARHPHRAAQTADAAGQHVAHPERRARPRADRAAGRCRRASRRARSPSARAGRRAT